MHSPFPNLLSPGLLPQILNQQELSLALLIHSPVSSLPPCFFSSFLFFSLSCSPFSVFLPSSLPLCFEPGHLSQVFLTLRCRGVVIRLHWSKSISQGHVADHECGEPKEGPGEFLTDSLLRISHFHANGRLQ